MSKKGAIIIAAVAFTAVAGAAYAFYRAGSGGVSGYRTVEAKIADLTEEVDIDGAVKAADSVDLAFERSGRIVSVNVKEDQTVSKGQTLASLNQEDAIASLRQAQASLASAELAFEKLREPPQELDLLEAQDAVSAASDAQEKARQDLSHAYDDARKAVSDAYQDLPAAVTLLHDVLHGADVNPSQDNIDFYADSANVYDSRAYAYRAAAENSYQSAKIAEEKGVSDFKAADMSADGGTEAVLAETYAAAKSVSDALKSAQNLLQLYHDKLIEKNIVPSPVGDSQLAALSAASAKASGDYAGLSASQKGLTASINALSSAQRAYAEKQAALKKLKDGAEQIDLSIARSRIDAAQAAVDAAQSAVNKGSISAPFDGQVSSLSASVGEMAAAGAPQISLVSAARFEIDAMVSEDQVGKIKVGESATVTLDAFGSETFAASVVSVDPAAHAANGANAYGVKLQFDREDERVKPGMTANVSIAVGSKKGVVAIPERAVITRGSAKIVVVPGKGGKPQEREIKIGMVGKGGMVEVIAGLSVGEKIISFGAN